MSRYRWLLIVVFLGPVFFGENTSVTGTIAAKAQVQLDEPIDGPEPVIDPASTRSDDKAIADRLRGIFQEINGLESVAVAVDAGVVNLSRSIADNESAGRAMAIAPRVSGVVTVEAQFERDLSVRRKAGLFG